MFITPDPHMLDSKEAENVGWHDALAELIDNSFDAGAMRVEIELKGKRLSVTDDGSGVKSICDLVKLGAHRKHKTTSLGVYGVGLKDAWMYFGPKIGVNTVCGGVKTTFEFDRSQLRIVDDRWLAPDPVSVPAIGTENGTTIYFDPLRHNRGRPDSVTLTKLGWTFMPALRAGKQILYSATNRRPIKACSMPILMDTVEFSFSVSGKQVTVTAGIMADGSTNPYPGLWHCYGHRIIQNSTIGTGSYSASKICGTVVLGPGWKLTPHKNELAEYSDELESGIFSALEPMLSKASRIVEDIVSSKLRAEIEVSLNAAIASAKIKEQRNSPENSTGAVVPKTTGRTRKRAEKADPTKSGSVESEQTTKRKRGVKIDWCQLGNDKIGMYDAMANTVMLNTDNSFISHAKATQNDEALRTVAIGLLCHQHCMTSTANAKQLLMIDKKDFTNSWGIVMASLKFGEKKRGK